MFADLKVLVIALSLGMDNFAVAMGLGLRKGGFGDALKVALLFAGLQTVFPAAGMLAGDYTGQHVGTIASYVGFAGLIVLGLYSLWLSGRGREGKKGLASPMGLLLTGLTVSIDSLAVGFTMGFLGLSFWFSVGALGLSAFVMSLLGHTFGDRIGRRIGPWAEIVAGSVLTLTGVGLLLEKLLA